MKRKLLALSAISSIFLAAASALAAPALPLEEYLGQVEETSPGLKAVDLKGEGNILEARGAEVLYYPNLFANYTHYNDKTETLNPPFQGDRTLGHQYSVGLAANTPIGLAAKYTYNITNTELVNATAIAVRNYYTAYNKVELTQSLWKNGLGSETRAQKAVVESSHLAKGYSNKYGAIGQRVQAENTYWRLAFARRSVEVQQDVLSRANKVLQWAKRRVALQLGDKGDLLQAQSSYDLRRLELMSAQEEEKNASRAFNIMRNKEGSSVAEELKIPSLEETLELAKKERARKGTRLDVKATEQSEALAAASAQLDREKLKPSVDVFASLAWTGRDAKKAEAVKEAQTSKRSNISLGVTLSIPLAVPQALDGLHGNSLTQEGSRYAVEQKRLEESLEWKELLTKIAEARDRLDLLRSIERVQKEKYENEQQRLVRGRTTTYQALSFEQDYAATQLSRLRTQNEVLRLVSQFKLFQGEE